MCRLPIPFLVLKYGFTDVINKLNQLVFLLYLLVSHEKITCTLLSVPISPSSMIKKVFI